MKPRPGSAAEGKAPHGDPAPGSPARAAVNAAPPTVRFGLRAKFSLFMAGFTAVLVGLMAALVMRHESRLLERELRSRAQLVGHYLAENSRDALLIPDDLNLKLALDSFVASLSKEEDVLFANVLNHQNEIVVPMSEEGAAKRYVEPPGVQARASAGVAEVEVARWGRIYLVAAPVAEGGKTIGSVRVGFSREKIRKAIRESLAVLGAILAVLLVFGLVAATSLGRLLSTPIIRISQTLEKVGRGDLNVRVSQKGRDELGQLALTVNTMIQGLQEKELMRDAFGSYVAHEVADEILKKKNKLLGENVEITVLFSDIRNFTPLSESMDAPRLVGLLNRYFTRMVEVIHAHGGIVDKFIGDAIMAIYGAPLPKPDHAERAVQTAVDMIAALKELNAHLNGDGLPTLRIGVGIATGPVVAGSIGSQDRMQYTVIGDDVILAWRLQDLTKALKAQILISSRTKALISAGFATRLHPAQSVKGKKAATDVYEILPEGEGAAVTPTPEVEPVISPDDSPSRTVSESGARSEYEKAKSRLAEWQKRLPNPMADPTFAKSVALLREAKDLYLRKDYGACVEASRQVTQNFRADSGAN
ncbi:MAG: HAMP domain-containing protein [Nitrospirae bacterium]|nr:HAMP domain-containing protein [Nitrospirota bacterium]